MLKRKQMLIKEASEQKKRDKITYLMRERKKPIVNKIEISEEAIEENLKFIENELSGVDSKEEEENERD